MRYMHNKIYFNKDELKELESRNPTLFYLAQYVAEKAHVTAKIMGENWINVARGYGTNLLCPSELFYVPGTHFRIGDSKCYELRCWAMHDEHSENTDKPYRPCWFRRWNDFVTDVKSNCKED